MKTNDKILVLDNYDSFTYNLVQMIERSCPFQVQVHKNDKIALDEVEAFSSIVISPGPGIPSEAGITLDLVRRYAPSKKILGVCLGQQAIAEAFGGSLTNLSQIYHGVATTALQTYPEAALLQGLPERIEVGRYHSWAVNREGFPKQLRITSVDSQGMIMSLEHTTYQVHGVQYHPESILTPYGKQIISNFLSI